MGAVICNLAEHSYLGRVMTGEVVCTAARWPFLELWPEEMECTEAETGPALAVAWEVSGVATAEEVRHMSSLPASKSAHLSSTNTNSNQIRKGR